MANGEVNNIDRMFQEVFKGTVLGREVFEDVEAKRKADDEHRAEIEEQAEHTLSSALGSLHCIGISDETKLTLCKDVISLISAGEVENVTINY